MALVAPGGEYFPICMADGTLVWGAHQYAELAGDDLEPLGSFNGSVPCLARKSVGKGSVYYCGTNLGQAAERDPAGLKAVLRMAAATAGIEPTGRLRAKLPGTIHLDILSDGAIPRFAVVVSRADREQAVQMDGRGCWQGIFSDVVWELDGPTTIVVPADFAEIFWIGIPDAGK